jgi:hypothetical protein
MSGLPRDFTWSGKTVHTGIWKSPVQGRRTVRKLNIVGDGQGDLAGHGGEQRAVFVYRRSSYGKDCKKQSLYFATIALCTVEDDAYLGSSLGLGVRFLAHNMASDDLPCPQVATETFPSYLQLSQNWVPDFCFAGIQSLNKLRAHGFDILGEQ